MNLLVYTNLYPSKARPRHGIFVKERLGHLVESGEVSASVCALRPQIPLFAGATSISREANDERNGVTVRGVPVPTLPLVSNWVDPIIWARSSFDYAAEVVAKDREGTILDAHFLYPDGVAAVLLARRLGVPVVLTARGSDVNVKCRNWVVRRWINWAVKNSAATITVSAALEKSLRAYGVDIGRNTVIRNGVDLDQFKREPAGGARHKLRLQGFTLLTVGHLVENKGHDIAIKSLLLHADTNLVIVGEGECYHQLAKLVAKLGLASRVTFVGYVPHEQMSEYYSAADVTVLASAREGMPNVILESIACGTRVIATRVGGIVEIVRSRRAGVLMSDRTPEALGEAISRIRQSPCSPEETRDYASRFSWEPAVQEQLALYRRVLRRPGSDAAVAE